MKILYAIQGTGNGHLSRAKDIIPLLQQHGNLDILVSGTQADVDLPFTIKYRFKGLSFIFGKKGGIDMLKTYKNANIKRLFKEISSLPVHDYDVVINDFEPVSAWACHINNKDCIALSHQAAVLNKFAPQPKIIDLAGKSVLRKYAPSTVQYGFHFRAYDDNIFTPVIRQQVRELKTENNKHYTVYLPAYDDERIIKVLRNFKHIEWQVFSKHNKKAFKQKNISVYPINNEVFINSMAKAEGILCGAGFETPAEALFMQKKLMVIPMKGQYEQQCNAAALKDMGVPVIKSLKTKHADKIKSWLVTNKKITVNYPDITANIIQSVLANAIAQKQNSQLKKLTPAPKHMRYFIFKKIFTQLS